MAVDTYTPEVLWAQRSSKTDAASNFIYLTINVPDIKNSDLKLDIQPQTVTFSGTSDTLKRKFEVELSLWGEIDPKASATHHTSKNIELKLQKKELTEEYWPRLLKDSKRMHFLKTDFDKWVDQDEQNEMDDGLGGQFGGGMGMPGMGGMGGGDFGNLDFSQLGGGMGGMGGMGDDMEDDDERDDTDDEMPALEGETKESGKDKDAGEDDDAAKAADPSKTKDASNDSSSAPNGSDKPSTSVTDEKVKA